MVVRINLNSPLHLNLYSRYAILMITFFGLETDPNKEARGNGLVKFSWGAGEVGAAIVNHANFSIVPCSIGFIDVTLILQRQVPFLKSISSTGRPCLQCGLV